jgi:hypothetical protein
MVEHADTMEEGLIRKMDVRLLERKVRLRYWEAIISISFFCTCPK